MKEYTKYCAPLLHLSGAVVTLLTTDDKNNGISLVSKVPENADAIIIAGGDGTVSDVRLYSDKNRMPKLSEILLSLYFQVVTGLLRRFSADPSQKLLPIGILPLGKTNSVAKQLYDDETSKNDSINRYRIMLKSAYSIVREITQNISAMEIENIDISDVRIHLNLNAVVFPQLCQVEFRISFSGPVRFVLRSKDESSKIWLNSLSVFEVLTIF